MPDDTFSPLIQPHLSQNSRYSPIDEIHATMNERKPLAPGQAPRRKNFTVILILSYVLDWSVLIAVGVVGTILGNITPNKRPFSLEDPNISYVSDSNPLAQNRHLGPFSA